MSVGVDLTSEIDGLRQRALKLSGYMQKIEARLLDEEALKGKSAFELQDSYDKLHKIQLESLEFIRKWIALKIEGDKEEDQEVLEIAKRLKVMEKSELEKVKRSLIQLVPKENIEGVRVG